MTPFSGPEVWVFGEGVRSARGATAILGCGDHTRNMFGTSLHTAYCRQTIALETAEIMHWFFDHCELLRRMNYCTNYCDGKQLLQRHPLRNPPLLRTPNQSGPRNLGQTNMSVTRRRRHYISACSPTLQPLHL